MIEGYALNGPPEKTKAVSDILKSLNPGDLVAIKYATDFERHRILQIEVRPSPTRKGRPGQARRRSRRGKSRSDSSFTFHQVN